MLKRRAYDQLMQWKQAKTQQSMLVTGARQVGKTTIIREFGKNNYKSTAEISFLGNRQAIDAVASARDARDLLLFLSALSRTEIVPGETLVFLDEIQACEDVVTWVKFLREASGVDFVLSGSLLGVDSFNIRSVPVGFLQTMRMHPLDFFEFCQGCGIPESALSTVRSCFAERTPVPAFLHDQLIDLFYKYLMIGGMPDAVQSFVNRSDAVAARNVQSAILDTYRMDMTQYVGSAVDRSHIKTIYDAIPNQLNKENKRFKFAKMEKNLRFSHLATAFDWLENAGVVLPTMRVSDPVYPLGLSADTNSFKLFLNDVGLLTAQLMPNSDVDILSHRASMNFGSVFENAVAQELFAQGAQLFYYNSKKLGEVDFVMQNKLGEISLVEVKSGKEYKRHRAMSNLLKTDNYHFAHAYVLHDGNVSIDRNETATPIEYLPTYMTSLI